MRGQQFFHALALVAALAAVSTLSSAQAPSLTQDVLHTFTGPPDGTIPNPLIRDAEGNLYGTTPGGGLASCPNGHGAGCGTVFEVAKNRQYTVLYRFRGNGDGAFPVAGVSRDAAGNLFGTTQGGNGSVSTVFKVDKTGDETVLFSFNNFSDGAFANTIPILDAMGNLYGTTYYGGDSSCGFNGNGCGVVYKVSKNGQFSVLHTFTSIKTGMQPGNLVMDAEGNLYGATNEGGDLTCEHQVACGTVFEIAKNGKFTVLYRFKGKADGSYPGCVTADGAGGLYGETGGGGDLNCNPPFGCGTIFKMKTTGKLHKPDVLYAFTPIFPNNEGSSCLVRDSGGNLYGTHAAGTGAHSGGYLFELDTSGKYTDLYDFPIIESPDGASPTGVLLAPNGDFYGTCDYGGDDSCGPNGTGCGTVFRLRH
jgi:uncharacterized repeat protein (TIGR03803 family)